MYKQPILTMYWNFNIFMQILLQLSKIQRKRHPMIELSNNRKKGFFLTL